MKNNTFNPIERGLRLLLKANHVSILIYHQVLPQFDPMHPEEITAEIFDRHLRWVKANFNVLRLDQAIAAQQANRLPPRALAITFDDGYQNNFTTALPLLKRHDLTATFFIASDFLNGGIMWNDRVVEALREYRNPSLDLQWLDLGQRSTGTDAERQTTAYSILRAIKHQPPQQRQQSVERICEDSQPPTNLMLTTEQLLQLHQAGMEIGGHSCSHPILSRLDPHQIQYEIDDNKHTIETIIDAPITSFAYPNGQPHQDYDQHCIDTLKRAGYQQAVSTAWGVNAPEMDRYQLRRFTPWGQTQNRFMAQMIRNQFTKPAFVG